MRERGVQMDGHGRLDSEGRACALSGVLKRGARLHLQGGIIMINHCNLHDTRCTAGVTIGVGRVLP